MCGGGQSNPTSPFFRDDASRFWRKDRKRTPSSRPGRKIRSWGWEGVVTRTKRMRDRARGCRKRGENLGWKEKEGCGMLAEAKSALGQDPGREVWGENRLHARCRPHPSVCPRELISAFHSIRLAGLLPSPPSHLVLSMCLEEAAGGGQQENSSGNKHSLCSAF